MIYLKEQYTIFYSKKSPTVITFHLTQDEVKKINYKYYSLKLDKIKKEDAPAETIYLKDKCETMPKDNTTLQIQTKEKKQELQIDLYCDDFYLSNFAEANRVKKFINFILLILHKQTTNKKSSFI